MSGNRVIQTCILDLTKLLSFHTEWLSSTLPVHSELKRIQWKMWQRPTGLFSFKLQKQQSIPNVLHPGMSSSSSWEILKCFLSVCSGGDAQGAWPTDPTSSTTLFVQLKHTLSHISASWALFLHQWKLHWVPFNLFSIQHQWFLQEQKYYMKPY